MLSERRKRRRLVRRYQRAEGPFSTVSSVMSGRPDPRCFSSMPSASTSLNCAYRLPRSGGTRSPFLADRPPPSHHPGSPFARSLAPPLIIEQRRASVAVTFFSLSVVHIPPWDAAYCPTSRVHSSRRRRFCATSNSARRLHRRVLMKSNSFQVRFTRKRSRTRPSVYLYVRRRIDLLARAVSLRARKY